MFYWYQRPILLAKAIFFFFSIYNAIYLYNTNHPNGTVYGGSAILIKTSIRHVQAEKYEYVKIRLRP